MQFIKKIIGLPLYILEKLDQIADNNKSHQKLYAYYAFPIFVALLISSVVIRTFNLLFPDIRLFIGGTHIHHFTYGILILLVCGYAALCVRTDRARYILAVIYGIGSAFLLDEFYVWLRLDSSSFSHSQYNALVIALSFLLVILLFPAGVREFRSILGKEKYKQGT